MTTPRRLRVLVVDDYPDTADSYAAVFRAVGYDARTATTGPEALRLAEGWGPDAAVIDLMMPGMDGFALADRLCAQQGRRPVLIAVSGSILAAHRERAARAFDHHLLKPVDPRALADLLESTAAEVCAARPHRLGPVGHVS